MGVGVVAEGVESSDQLEALKRLGCDSAQGFLLGRPSPDVRDVVDLPALEARQGAAPAVQEAVR